MAKLMKVHLPLYPWRILKPPMGIFLDFKTGKASTKDIIFIELERIPNYKQFDIWWHMVVETPYNSTFKLWEVAHTIEECKEIYEKLIMMHEQEFGVDEYWVSEVKG